MKYSIPIKYKGVRYRSKLEAQWAKFFDHFGIRHIYEPEVFVLDDGTKYLPDFYLPDSKQYFEVKGIMDHYDYHKIEELRREMSNQSIVTEKMTPWEKEVAKLYPCAYELDGATNICLIIGYAGGKIDVPCEENSQYYVSDEVDDEPALVKCRFCGKWSFKNFGAANAGPYSRPACGYCGQVTDDCDHPRRPFEEIIWQDEIENSFDAITQIDYLDQKKRVQL